MRTWALWVSPEVLWVPLGHYGCLPRALLVPPGRFGCPPVRCCRVLMGFCWCAPGSLGAPHCALVAPLRRVGCSRGAGCPWGGTVGALGVLLHGALRVLLPLGCWVPSAQGASLGHRAPHCGIYPRMPRALFRGAPACCRCATGHCGCPLGCCGCPLGHYWCRGATQHPTACL